VTDLATAQQAVDTILEQGEGARGHWQQAHFGQFVQILDEYREMLAANPAFDPACGAASTMTPSRESPSG
jgi:Ferritin-like